MRGYLREDQIKLLGVISAKYECTYYEALLLLFKALKDQNLRSEIVKIINEIGNTRTKTIKRIYLGEAYPLIRKIARANRMTVSAVLDLLITSLQHGNNDLFSNIKYLNLI